MLVFESAEDDIKAQIIEKKKENPVFTDSKPEFFQIKWGKLMPFILLHTVNWN